MRKGKSDELRAEYSRTSLGRGVRGKYLKEYRRVTNLVLLTPEVAKAFPSAKAVNDALSSLITVARRTTRQSRRVKE
ncbi:MAG: hypothetical protein ABIP05_13840 [Nitrospiraceae bacterium]